MLSIRYDILQNSFKSANLIFKLEDNNIAGLPSNRGVKGVYCYSLSVLPCGLNVIVI